MLNLKKKHSCFSISKSRTTVIYKVRCKDQIIRGEVQELCLSIKFMVIMTGSEAGSGSNRERLPMRPNCICSSIFSKLLITVKAQSRLLRRFHTIGGWKSNWGAHFMHLSPSQQSFIPWNDMSTKILFKTNILIVVQTASTGISWKHELVWIPGSMQ